MDPVDADETDRGDGRHQDRIGDGQQPHKQSDQRNVHDHQHTHHPAGKQLLDHARASADAGALDIVRLDLSELAAEVTRELVPLALKRDMDLGFEADQAVTVQGDELLLRELLKNLIDNAIRYCPPGARITVRVFAAADGPAAGCLEVEDDGPGIPSAERERVFDRFYGGSGTDTEGSGLGLAIVKQVVQTHCGRIALGEGAGARGCGCGCRCLRSGLVIRASRSRREHRPVASGMRGLEFGTNLTEDAAETDRAPSVVGPCVAYLCRLLLIFARTRLTSRVLVRRPPMPDTINRNKLMLALDDWNGEPKDENWPIDEKLVVTWWGEYKAWERDETIARAFGDNRLAVKELQSEVSVYGGPNSTVNFTAFEKYGRNTRTNPNPKVHYKDHKYDTGVESYMKRSSPAYFLGGEGPSKYTEGLHDVSMSILRAGKPIDQQTYTDLGDQKSDQKYVIFVPLPEPEDQAVFNRLNDIAKRVKLKCQVFYQRIRTFRAEMTRVKLAWDEDMASGFIALAPDNKARPKLRYGMVNTYRVDGNVLTATAEHRAKARDTARPRWEEFRRWPERTRNYKSILTEMTKKYNECTIAIRKHENPRFPVFARWNFAQKRFDKFDPPGRANTPDLDVPVQTLPG